MDVKYYQNLLIKQYHDKTKARLTIKALLQPNIDLYNNIISKLSNKLNIDNATGKWLDIIGSYVGISRYFDIDLQQTTPEQAYNIADDETYRIILKFKLINYYSQNSIKSINETVYNYLNNDVVFVNGLDMTISYIIFKDEESSLVKIIEHNKNMLPAPSGVKINYIIEVPDRHIFGMCNANNIDYKPDYIVGLSSKDNMINGILLNKNNII